jgi:hypothetical protein
MFRRRGIDSHAAHRIQNTCHTIVIVPSVVRMTRMTMRGVIRVGVAMSAGAAAFLAVVLRSHR